MVVTAHSAGEEPTCVLSAWSPGVLAAITVAKGSYDDGDRPGTDQVNGGGNFRSLSLLITVRYLLTANALALYLMSVGARVGCAEYW